MVGLHLLYSICLSIYLLILYYLRKYIEVHGQPSSAVFDLFSYIYLLILYYLRKYIEVHGQPPSAVFYLSIYLSINCVLFKEVYRGTWSAFICCILSVYLSINRVFLRKYIEVDGRSSSAV